MDIDSVAPADNTLLGKTVQTATNVLIAYTIVSATIGLVKLGSEWTNYGVDKIRAKRALINKNL